MSYTKQNFKSGDILYASQLNAMDNEISTLEAEVNSTKNMVGHPYTATTASAMSDQTKIYVYTGSETGYTAGHWYYHNGTAWTDGGVYNSVAVNTDTSLTVSGQAADSKAVGDAIDDLDSDLSDVRSDLNKSAIYKVSDAEGVDLDVTDPNGNVVVRFANGYVQTKNFDSQTVAQNISSLSSGKVNVNQGVANEGKAMVVGADGNLAPADVQIEVDDTLSQEGQAADAKATGDRIRSAPKIVETDANGVDLDIADEDGNVLVRFSGGEILAKNFQTSKFGAFFHTESEADFDLADVNGNSIFTVDKGHVKTKWFNSLTVNPNIVTVRKDGFGDYTSLRSAVESITDADPLDNPYVIEIHEGQYNIMDDYTAEEILSAGEEHYTDTSFVGLKITNGISLRGVGCRDNVIIYGYLDPQVYTNNNRNNIATLNTQGECNLENLTIIGERIRYAVHDDFGDSFRLRAGRNPHRIVKNCVFIAKNTTGGASYGAGTSAARDYYFKDCAFYGGSCGIHTISGMPYSGTFLFEGCRGVGLYLGDYSTASTNSKHLAIINDCDFDVIKIGKNSASYTPQHIKMCGTGSYRSFIDVPTGFVYETGNVIVVDGSYSVGDVVTIDNAAASSASEVYGVCLGTQNGQSYIQIGGYIKASLFGLSPSAGDYIGVSNGAVAVVSTANDSIGKVVVRQSIPFIHLTI